MKRTVILTLILVLVVVAAGGAFYVYRSNVGGRLLNRARLALRANKPEKAHDLASKYIRANPDDWEGYYLLSRAYGAQRQFSEAHAALQQAATAGADKQVILISQADLLITEGQATLSSQEAPELRRGSEKLTEALAVLSGIEPTKPSVGVDVLYRIGVTHHAIAGAQGRLAVVLQRRSLRIRAGQAAPPLQSEWAQVFAGMDAGRRATLMEILQSTLEFRGYIEADVKIVREAAEIVFDMLATRPPEESFRQQAWIVAACLSLLQADLERTAQSGIYADWLNRGDQWCLEALAADEADWQAMHLMSQISYRRADAALVQARGAMLDVIARDPSRSDAASMAVKFCLTSQDREGLVKARAALEPLADRLPATALLLIRHALRLAEEELPPGPTYRDRIAEIAKDIDGVAERYPDDAAVLLVQAEVAFRLQRYEDAAALAEKVLRVDSRGPGAGYARLVLARIDVATKGAETVEAELTQLRADHPNAPEVQYTYAMAMIALGKNDSAADAYRSLTTLGKGRPLMPAIPGPDARRDPEIELNRAEIAVRLSDSAAAKEICDELIVAAKSPETAFHARGWLLRSWAQWRAQSDDPQLLLQLVLQANNTDYADEAAAAVDEVFAKAAEALRLAAAEPAGPTGPSRQASELFAGAMRLLPTLHTCRSMMNDREGAQEVIEALTKAPRLSSRHHSSLAAVLAQLGQFDTAEQMLRAEIARESGGGAELAYARLIELYISRGRIAEALAELDALLDVGGHTDSAQLRKAQILIAIGRREEANAIVTSLASRAIDMRDVALLQQLTSYYSRTSQADKTSEMLEHLARIRTPMAADYIVGASALAAVGRNEEAAAMYRRAIGLERDEATIPALYRDLAMLLDADQRRIEALAALAELRALPGPEDRRRVYQAEALFQEGSLMLRWGLYEQAAERFLLLAAADQEGSSAGRLALGQALAALGEIDRATRILAGISPGNPEYLTAQLLRISLAPDAETRIKLFDRLGRISPTHEGVLAERMVLLRQEGRADEAIEAYRRFAGRQGLAYRPQLPGPGRTESRPPLLAMFMLWEAGRNDEAAAEARRLAELTQSQPWQVRAALLTAPSDPQAAVAILETSWLAGQAQSDTPTQMGGLVALAGVSIAALAAEDDASAVWLSRVGTTARQAEPADLLLATLAAADDQAAATHLSNVQSVGGLGKAPAVELVAAVAADSAVRTEAAKLLSASVAAQIGMPWVTRDRAVDLLRARPHSQWAAALLHTYREDDAQSQIVEELLQPADCTVRRIVQADLLAAESKMDEAVELYKSVADQTGELNARMQYALALERSGRYADAIAQYVAVWESDQNPVAANNAAYRMQLLYGDDPNKLAEAHRLAAESVRLRPSVGAFRDTLGWIAYLRGHHEAAARELSEALRGMPTSPSVHYHVGMAEAAVGHRQLAIWHLQMPRILVDRIEEAGRPVSAEDQAAAQRADEVLAQMDAGT